ncbi:hypothetical protein TELCIR_22799, partial [Teladorsagia circumcincta]
AINRVKARKTSIGSDSALLTKRRYLKVNDGINPRSRKQSFNARTDFMSASLDETDEIGASPRRYSSNERARQNLLAQRRQSQIQ